MSILELHSMLKTLRNASFPFPPDMILEAYVLAIIPFVTSASTHTQIFSALDNPNRELRMEVTYLKNCSHPNTFNHKVFVGSLALMVFKCVLIRKVSTLFIRSDSFSFPPDPTKSSNNFLPPLDTNHIGTNYQPKVSIR